MASSHRERSRSPPIQVSALSGRSLRGTTVSQISKNHSVSQRDLSIVPETSKLLRPWSHDRVVQVPTSRGRVAVIASKCRPALCFTDEPDCWYMRGKIHLDRIVQCNLPNLQQDSYMQKVRFLTDFCRSMLKLLRTPSQEEYIYLTLEDGLRFSALHEGFDNINLNIETKITGWEWGELVWYVSNKREGLNCSLEDRFMLVRDHRVQPNTPEIGAKLDSTCLKIMNLISSSPIRGSFFSSRGGESDLDGASSPPPTRSRPCMLHFIGGVGFAE